MNDVYVKFKKVFSANGNQTFDLTNYSLNKAKQHCNLTIIWDSATNGNLETDTVDADGNDLPIPAESVPYTLSAILPFELNGKNKVKVILTNLAGVGATCTIYLDAWNDGDVNGDSYYTL